MKERMLFKRARSEVPRRERDGLVSHILLHAGDLIHIPPDTLHGIENLSDEVLSYVSAATPTVDWEAFYDRGPLRAQDPTEKESVWGG